MTTTKKLVLTRDRMNENDADDSDTDSLSDPQIRKRTPKRSATVSPATKHRFRYNRTTHRRRSDVYLSTADNHNIPSTSRARLSVEKIGYYSNNVPLRKTNSEPSVEQQQEALTLDAIRSLMESYQALPQTMSKEVKEIGKSTGMKRRATPSTSVIRITEPELEMLDVWCTPRESLVSDSSEEEMMNTDIEELRDAVESIQSLQRVLKIPNQHSSGSPITEMPKRSTSVMGNPPDSILKGITTNLGGHPRGVMQFLPSAQQNTFQPTLDSYTWNKQQASNYPLILRRKASAPENYLKFSPDRSSPRPRSTRIRSSETETNVFANGNAGNNKGVDSIAGVNRFSKLLNSLRGPRQTCDQWQYQNNLLMPPDSNVPQRQLQQSLLQADQLLWKRRSRASLRRHQEIRSMAVRELFDTERTFVESLEHLMQKYMRPLKQPLECTLIDTDLVDKIFYKIPEILAHHQVLYAALTTRMEGFQNDVIIGDVLLAHFTKQSMIETFMAFVDNFKHAKQTIWEARQRPAFEKYYMRCSREHSAKLDLNSLLILPIQRVPRYELILKQVLKHTSVDHCDYDKLVLVQKHVHQLAVVINCQREETEKMEQRLREIEAIVDGLDDLVSPDRIFIRYDVVFVKDSINENKMRCIFMMSDQLIVTSICKRFSTDYNRYQPFIQSPDFLDTNRFKLLIKISLDDVDMVQDTVFLLHNVEEELRSAQEDVNIISKIIDLAKLIKAEHSGLSKTLDNMYTNGVTHLKLLQEQMVSNPDLTTVRLKVTTFEGVETLTLQFPNAEKRGLWENAFLEAKHALKNSMHIEQIPPRLKSILIHRSRHGLTFNVGTPTLPKSAEGTPNVWVCSSDKFSGQVAILNVQNDPSIETSSNLGNSAITAICAVPPPRRTKAFPSRTAQNESDLKEMMLDSSSSELETSDIEPPSPAQSTIWIGNEDGEIFIFNYLDSVRIKTREKVVRLSMAIVEIIYLEEKVVVSISNKTQNQLLYFTRSKESNWNIDKPREIRLPKTGKVNCMIAVTNRLCFGCQNSVFLLNPHDFTIERSTELSTSVFEEVEFLVSVGSTIYAALKNSTTIILLNTFTLEIISEFGVGPILSKTLTTKEDIIRNHKLGNLRITALLGAKSQLWIGSSAGIVISTPVSRTKTPWVPNFQVCSVGHIGPCRFLTTVNVSYLALANNFNNRRMSLNAASLQECEQTYVISGGNGIENFASESVNEETGAEDACNHLIFWQL